MKYTLERTFQAYGGFWLPEAPGHIVEGRLSFEPAQGLRLELFRSIAAPDQSHWSLTGQMDAIPVILGKLVHGESVTLLDSFVARQYFGAGFSGPTEIVANRALVGIHVSDSTVPSFSRLALSVTSLDEWFSVEPFSVSPKSRGNRQIGVDARYRFPKELRIGVPAEHITIRSKQILHQDSTLPIWILSSSRFWRLSPRNQ